MAQCGGTLAESTPGEFQCSLGKLCAVAVTVRTYYATRDETLIEYVRAAHACWETAWVQAG